MLVLSAESACDVCAESYGADSLPHSIPCGHTFCAPCLTEIAKRHPHRGASCPLCREPFGSGDIRRIRTDQGVSSSPPYPQIQPYPNYYPAPQSAPARGVGGFGAAPLDEDALDADDGGDEDAARRLELRVLDATKKGNSFEDLSRLKREIDQWVARRPDREHMALKISAALLAAILVNGFQHNEARKTAKLAEDAKRKLESENYRLKVDMSKLTGAPPPPPPVLAPPAQLPAQPPPPPIPPVPVPVARAFGSSLAAKPSPLSKLGSARSQTPGPMPSHRPSAPAPTHRTLTPGPTPTQRTLTPAPSTRAAPPPAPRSQTPAARTTTTSSSASPYSPFARASATTSHLPVTPSPSSERHRVWMPSTPREEDDAGGGGVGKRPGTAAPPPVPGHGRSFSFGFARPRTANGHR